MNGKDYTNVAEAAPAVRNASVRQVGEGHEKEID